MTCPHCCCITLSTLFTGLYIYIHTYRCNLLFRFTLQRSKTRLRLLTWPLTMGGTSTRTLSLPYKPKHACMWDYIKGTHIILSIHAFVIHTQTHTQTRTFSHACAQALQRCPLITAKKRLSRWFTRTCVLYQSASSSM